MLTTTWTTSWPPSRPEPPSPRPLAEPAMAKPTTRSHVMRPSNSFTRLQDEVRDVAEVDRSSTTSGYRLIFDDGSSLLVRTRADVRATADVARSCTSTASADMASAVKAKMSDK